MAAVTLQVGCEMELIGDTIVSLQLIQERLAYRHGDAFRALDRMIEELGDNPGAVEIVHLEQPADGEASTMIAIPPARALAIVHEARRLGVI